MSVELGEFITATLVQISKGLTAANRKLSGVPAGTVYAAAKQVMDEHAGRQPLVFKLAHGADQSRGTGIHFDIVITALTNTESEGKVFVGGATVGANGTVAENTSHESRVQFSVEVSDTFELERAPIPEALPDY